MPWSLQRSRQHRHCYCVCLCNAGDRTPGLCICQESTLPLSYIHSHWCFELFKTAWNFLCRPPALNMCSSAFTSGMLGLQACIPTRAGIGFCTLESMVSPCKSFRASGSSPAWRVLMLLHAQRGVRDSGLLSCWGLEASRSLCSGGKWKQSGPGLGGRPVAECFAFQPASPWHSPPGMRQECLFC